MAKHAQQIDIEVDKTDALKKFARFQIGLANQLRVAMLLSMQAVGRRATSDYMIRAHVIHGGSGFNVGTAGSDKLNIRSSRLARSLIGGFSFAGGGMGEQESIREIKREGNTIVGYYGSKVPYAAIHEYGGTIKAKNAPYLVFKLGPFWYKKKQVTIPARPYLNPALKDAQPEINSIMAGVVLRWSEKVSNE